MKELTDEEMVEQTLAEQVTAIDESNKMVDTTESKNKNDEVEEQPVNEMPERPVNEASKYIGTNLRHKPGSNPFVNKDADNKIVENKKLSKLGENLGKNAEYRDGWIDVDRVLLGERSIFYPESWRFKIRPATVDAIRNWSTLDDENANSIDDVFNEILKSCLAIHTPEGPLPWGNINSWDRFFFLLLIREYTFVEGESKIKYDEECIECENPITFELTSQALMYDLPDKEVMSMYNPEERLWYIDPSEYDLDENPVTLYIPTLEKDANIKAWIINRLQENRNRKFDQVFIKFLSWMTPKISKDTTIAQRQIRELEMKYKSWDTDMFTFMDDVLRNIIVTPKSKLITTCPICGEEVTSDIRFPNSVRDLFNVPHRSRKFGSK